MIRAVCPITVTLSSSYGEADRLHLAQLAAVAYVFFGSRTAFLIR
jgi:hypothetical protein